LVIDGCYYALENDCTSPTGCHRNVANTAVIRLCQKLITHGSSATPVGRLPMQPTCQHGQRVRCTGICNTVSDGATVQLAVLGALNRYNFIPVYRCGFVGHLTDASFSKPRFPRRNMHGMEVGGDREDEIRDDAGDDRIRSGD